VIRAFFAEIAEIAENGLCRPNERGARPPMAPVGSGDSRGAARVRLRPSRAEMFDIIALVQGVLKRLAKAF
jgi:hypothetical protein